MKRTNITFLLSKEDKAKFKAKCKENDELMSYVLQNFVDLYISEDKVYELAKIIAKYKKIL